MGFQICGESIILHAVTEAQRMEWTVETIDRLHELHVQYVDRLRADLSAANRVLGSSTPERTGLRYLTRAEFDALLRQPTDDAEVTRLWIRRIIRGHEGEFPELKGATDSPHAMGRDPLAEHSKQRCRKTGT
jgi:hypothetical protein